MEQVSPATTVSVAIQEADSSLSVDQANKLAADYLGITTEQLTSDYINNLDNSSADVVASALAVQRASVQVATIIETASLLSDESNNEATCLVDWEILLLSLMRKVNV